MGINFRNKLLQQKASKPTLDNITLDIFKKAIHHDFGSYRSGKSTLVQHMNALLLPDEGEVEIFGKHITKKYKDKLKDTRKSRTRISIS